MTFFQHLILKPSSSLFISVVKIVFFFFYWERIARKGTLCIISSWGTHGRGALVESLAWMSLKCVNLYHPTRVSGRDSITS